MLITRWKHAKNKKGISLVEMIAAIAITSILAAVLSAMIVPVMNTYRNAETKATLQEAVSARLNDIAYWLRSADGVYLSSSTQSFPETNYKNLYQFQGVRDFNVKWGFANVNYYGTTGYKYPELKFLEFSSSDTKNHTSKWAWQYTPSMKLDSDIFQNDQFTCPTWEDFFFIVRKNPDGGDHLNVLEVHLHVKKGNVEYEGVKTFVCENLMIADKDIYKATFDKDGNTGKWKEFKKADESTGTNPSKWNKYYSVWFSRDV